MKPHTKLGRVWIAAAMSTVLLGLVALAACGDDQQTVEAEELPEIQPNLPSVPNVPPPEHPLQYDDGSWTVYGLRKRMRQNLNEEVRVKAYVVKIFTPEPCPEEKTCPPPPMPHLWLGDDLDETSARKLLRVVGYAQSHQDIEDAREEAEKHPNREPEEQPPGVPPLVWDWQQGQMYRVKGRFTRASGVGFADSEGLLEYMEHECLDCPEEEDED